MVSIKTDDYPENCSSDFFTKSNDSLIKENKTLKNEIESLISQIEAMKVELDAYSYSITHDIKAPLRSIDAYVTALIEDYSDLLDDKGKEYINRIKKSTDYIKDLIDGLLSLTRLTSSDIRFRRINLSEIVRSQLNEFSKIFQDRVTEFLIQENLFIEGDYRLISIMINNLLDNAWKFSNKKDKTQIEFGKISRNNIEIFYIKDYGAGFNQAYSQKLFMPFQRFHTLYEFEGIGIGLATVKKIIKIHNGKIWAEAEVDKGATFFFTIGQQTDDD